MRVDIHFVHNDTHSEVPIYICNVSQCIEKEHNRFLWIYYTSMYLYNTSKIYCHISFKLNATHNIPQKYLFSIIMSSIQFLRRIFVIQFIISCTRYEIQYSQVAKADFWNVRWWITSITHTIWTPPKRSQKNLRWITSSSY